MNGAFKECLKNRKIIPFPRAKGFVQKELAAAEEDLAEAKDRLINKKYKYATINSYYSIFHAARALLDVKGDTMKGQWETIEGDQGDIELIKQ